MSDIWRPIVRAGFLGLLFLGLVGCASSEAWVLVSVRDTLTRSPVPDPWLTVAPRGDNAKASSEKTQRANHFGTARINLVTGQAKYNITVDALGYDLHTFELPSLDTFFPSGQWHEAQPTRRYPLRPDNTLELMVTIEP